MTQVQTTTNAPEFGDTNDDYRLAAAYTEHGYELKTYDDLFGQLWLYSTSLGPLGVVRAQSFDDAYSIVLDEFLQPLANDEELIEAYGFYLLRDPHSGRTRGQEQSLYYLCTDTPETVPHTDVRVFGHPRNMVMHGTKEHCQTHARKLIEDYELDLIEGYHYQPNATGTGIVATDLNGEWLEPLSADIIERQGFTLTWEQM